MTDYIATDTELTSVANAIRAKGGTNAQLEWPTEYVSAIELLPNGIEDKAEPNDVIFIDYDGTILYSYTASDFLQLTAMPANPDRTSDGLVAEGWNWTLEQAKTEVTNNGYVVIGQTYQTSDGKTHIFIDLSKEPGNNELNYALYFSLQDSDGSAIVAWGDGTTTSTYGDNVTHTYTAGGRYEITIEAPSGGVVCFAGGNSYNTIRGSVYYVYDYYKRSSIYKVYLGNNVKIAYACFRNMYNLQTVTIPSNIKFIGTYCFCECNSLKGIVFPSRTTYFYKVDNFTCGYCYTLRSASVGYNIGIAQSVFYQCKGLQYVSIPTNSTPSEAGQNSSFYECNSLKRIAIPSTKVNIPQNCFYNCYSLNSVTIPQSITSLYANCFLNCAGVKEYHMKPTTPPSLANTSTISSQASGFKIYVPRSANQTVLNAYKTASNWSTFASYMQEEPE